KWHATYIQRRYAEAQPVFPETALRQALQYAENRATAHNPSIARLLHGDPHSHNLLATNTSSNTPFAFKFIDPEPLIAEPAYDLGVLMREWDADILQENASAPFERGRARAAHLSQLTSQPLEAIWEWGYLERLSSALLLHELGQLTEARTMLDIALHWAKS
ncbi:MAG: aminoglycoside phosphotransferase family protein, partial [Bacteroidota bacterium]